MENTYRERQRVTMAFENDVLASILKLDGKYGWTGFRHAKALVVNECEKTPMIVVNVSDAFNIHVKYCTLLVRYFLFKELRNGETNNFRNVKSLNAVKNYIDRIGFKPFYQEA